jgi:malate/lactate dehydrogenase
LYDWNGVDDVCLGAPTIIGQNGVIDVWPLELPRAEKKLLADSAKILKGYIAEL